MILNVSALIISTLGDLLFITRMGGVRATVAPFVWASTVVLLLYGFALAGFHAPGASWVPSKRLRCPPCRLVPRS